MLLAALDHEIAILDGVDDGVSPERSAQFREALPCALAEVEQHLGLTPACEARVVARVLGHRAERDA
jgi:hypothetical protein